MTKKEILERLLRMEELYHEMGQALDLEDEDEEDEEDSEDEESDEESSEDDAED